MLDVNIGTVAWATIAFLIVLMLLKKFAWKPILSALDAREQSIKEALSAAEKARAEMASLQSQNEELLREARMERDQMLKEAREAKDAMIGEAKGQAKTEADKIIASARENIQHEKMAAISDLKNQVAQLSIEIAEKIVREKLGDDARQSELVKNLMDDVKLN
ncbi:MAG: F0F1 ATP synthase subunit B [Cryomorphaceae bacterium]|nr:MAG: F0F1 ATP synthase subunit B [Cryomorphaceae bacterium]